MIALLIITFTYFIKSKMSNNNSVRTILSMDTIRMSAFIVPVLVFVITTISMILFFKHYQYATWWDNWDGAVQNADRFCEAWRTDQLIRQPSNTWSNLGYFLVGLICLTLGLKDRRNKLGGAITNTHNFIVRFPIFSILIGVFSIYLFVGSYLYHASLALFFQQLDVSAMYGVVLCFIAFNLYRMVPSVGSGEQKWNTLPFILGLMLLVDVFFFVYLKSIDINITMLSLIGIAMIVHVFNNRINGYRAKHYMLFWNIAIVVLVIAFAIWILDVKDIWCTPYSFWQGHAVWHILTATSILFMYLYYRSDVENISPKSI